VVRRAAHVDAEHAAHTMALLEIGASVQSLAGVGLGCPDLLVGYRGVNCLIEIKNPPAASGAVGGEKSGKRLNEKQERWHAMWKGHVAVSTSPEQSVKIVTDEAEMAAEGFDANAR